MKKLTDRLDPALHPTFLGIGGLVFALFMLVFQLCSLVPMQNKAEVIQAGLAASLKQIIKNPLNVQHKLLQYGFSHFESIFHCPGRYASAAIGLLVAISLFTVLREWYTRRVAFLGAALFVCSAWFLHTGRFGTDAIMYATPIMALACVVWAQRRDSGSLAILAAVAVLVWLLYVPGMIWIVLPAFWWQFGRISRFLHDQKPPVIVLIVVGLAAAITPLVWAMYSTPALIKPYLGLPQDLPNTMQFITNVANVPVQLFLRGPNDPALWLGRLPLIDWFGTVMFIIGVYAYYFKRSLDRTKFLIYIFVIGTLLVGLGGPVNISILLPFVYLLIAGGIALMLQQWLTVFPRNPLARTVGPLLMTLAVIASIFYNIQHYFIAWPNTPETKQVYSVTVAPPPKQ